MEPEKIKSYLAGSRMYVEMPLESLKKIIADMLSQSGLKVIDVSVSETEIVIKIDPKSLFRKENIDVEIREGKVIMSADVGLVS
ncbi:MAG: hypothetical protein C0179_03450 [Fervidicoccus sp.]|nr:MAG: hypothetical protein C0179_03450 [Fervidicoccus sp.]